MELLASSRSRERAKASARPVRGGSGGADLNDLLRLADVAREVDGLDPSRGFLAGRSRGGTMVYLALKRHMPVRAAAVIGGVSDLAAFASQRPELAAGDEDYDGWARLWPAWEERRDELLRERSAVAWPERLDAPLLILHARSDRMVPVSHAVELAGALDRAGKEFELVVYGTDGHSLPLNRVDRNRHIIEWFRAHAR